MSERTDPAWDEYLSTGIDPTGGELEDADKQEVTDEIILYVVTEKCTRFYFKSVPSSRGSEHSKIARVG